MAAVPFTASAMGMTMAPRVEIYTVLACSRHKPEYARHLKLSKDMGLPYDDYLDDVSPILPLPPIALGAAIVDRDIHPTAANDTIYFESSASFDREAAAKDKCASDPEVQAAVATLAMGEPIGRSSLL